MIDLDHLAAQTAGDESLTHEILGLFGEQMRTLARTLDPCLAGHADDPDQVRLRLATLHRAKGAALAVGAFEVAEQVARMERMIESAAPPASLLRDLGALCGLFEKSAAEAAGLIAARRHGGLAKAGESG